MPKGILESLLSGKGAIVPHVQPIYRLRDNQLVAQEYLARHMDEAGVTHPVGPILQDPSLSAKDRLALDLRFLEATFMALAQRGNGTHLHFVNLEPVSLEAPGFWRCLPRWLEALPFPVEYVVMEFTESQGVHDLEALQTYAKRLRDVGLRVAVDDLGAGFASGKAQVELVAGGKPRRVLNDRPRLVGDDTVAAVEHPQRIEVTQASRTRIDALRGRSNLLGRCAQPPVAAISQIGACGRRTPKKSHDGCCPTLQLALA